jgi:hypothetical protein
LTPIYVAFCDALALVSVAQKAVTQSSYAYQREANVLRQGVDALDKVSHLLEGAEAQLDVWRRRNSHNAGSGTAGKRGTDSIIARTTHDR